MRAQHAVYAARSCARFCVQWFHAVILVPQVGSLLQIAERRDRRRGHVLIHILITPLPRATPPSTAATARSSSSSREASSQIRFPPCSACTWVTWVTWGCHRPATAAHLTAIRPRMSAPAGQGASHMSQPPLPDKALEGCVTFRALVTACVSAIRTVVDGVRASRSVVVLRAWIGGSRPIMWC